MSGGCGVSIADDKTILAATVVAADAIACPLSECTFRLEVPAVPLSETVANALGMSAQALGQLHAEQAAWDAAGKMRRHLAAHSPEQWLTQYRGGAA